MLNYCSLLLENTQRFDESSNQKFVILVEGYNPERVKEVALTFMDMAEDNGFSIPEDELKIFNRKWEEMCSVYFVVNKNNMDWKIRTSDHSHNDRYDNDVSYNIVLDDKPKVNIPTPEFKPTNLSLQGKNTLHLPPKTEKKESDDDDFDVDGFTEKHFNKFLTMASKDISDIGKILQMIDTTNFVYDFLKDYEYSAHWIVMVMRKHRIPVWAKQTNQFKQAMQYKCVEVCRKYPNLYNTYRKTPLFQWNYGERLNVF